MHNRESEIHFSRWIFPTNDKNWYSVIVISILFHVALFALLSYLKPKTEVVADQTSKPIHVHFGNSNKNSSNLASKQTPLVEGPKKHRILVDKNPHSKSTFNSLSQENPPGKKEENKPSQTPQNQVNSQTQPNRFLPGPDYFQGLPKETKENTEPFQADGGDIPIEGPSLAPRNGPQIVHRYVEKDMSLFQFSKEFRERFGAIWNSEDRILPLGSALKPGDIVYYKIYIRTDGNMDKYENISKLKQPQKDFSDADEIFAKVIAQVFPMQVPPKYENQNKVISEILAIQVVGRNAPVRYSF